MLGLLGCFFLEMDFLLNLAWVCPCWPLVPSLSIPARGEQGDGPMDNEGFYVDNEGNMVHVIVPKHPRLSTNEALVVHGIIPMGETSKGF